MGISWNWGGKTRRERTRTRSVSSRTSRREDKRAKGETTHVRDQAHVDGSDGEIEGVEVGEGGEEG